MTGATPPPESYHGPKIGQLRPSPSVTAPTLPVLIRDRPRHMNTIGRRPTSTVIGLQLTPPSETATDGPAPPPSAADEPPLASLGAATFQLTDLVKISIFFTQIYDLSRRGEEDEAIDQIFNVIDDCLIGFRVGMVEDVLENIAPEKMLPSMIHSLLMVTYGAKRHLKKRGDFLARARDAVRAEWGDDEADDLIRYE